MLTRMFAYFTLFSYLVVGGLCARFMMPEMVSVELPMSYFSLFSDTNLNTEEALIPVMPEIAFSEIKFPVEKRIIKKPVVKVAAALPVLKNEKVSPHELPFHEPVKLAPVYMNHDLPENLISLYIDLKEEMVAETKLQEDVVSTKLASNEEPEFFEYPVEAPAAKKETPETETVEVLQEDIKEAQETPILAEVAEEVAVEDLVAFDYSKAEQDIKEEKLPTVSTVTTQGSLSKPSQYEHSSWEVNSKPSKNQGVTSQPEVNSYTKNDGLLPFVEPRTFPSRVSIQIVGTNLKETQSEAGFELRFQDDLSESIQDYNSGTVTLDQELSLPTMTRSTSVLKRGFIPTNTDLILEEGVAEASIPMIEEETFNQLIEPYESRGPMGAVLVELDESVSGASLDVPYSQVLRLNENLQVTESDDYVYELFLGVKAGNALLSYKNADENLTSKIIHIHEREVTFESNHFESVKDEKVKLFEEGLLGQEKTPLIISSEVVKEFATTKTAQKINNHTFKTNFNKVLLGSRRYLELSHQNEPVFVGLKENTSLEIPSESFMRYILSKFEGGNLGNRCLVQINLGKKAQKVDIGAESIQSSLATSMQILDKDGKFYESVGEKSVKVIIVGEHQGAPELGQDGKINVKISYQDGSLEYLSTYCSPNTYLVEQL